jgi:hypothetical protein
MSIERMRGAAFDDVDARRVIVSQSFILVSQWKAQVHSIVRGSRKLALNVIKCVCG